MRRSETARDAWPYLQLPRKQFEYAARLMRRTVPSLLLLALLTVLGLGRAFAAAPTAVGTIPAQALVVGGSAGTVDVAAYFSDADMDTLTYAATSGDTDVVTVGVSGSTVTLTPAGTGSASVTVTASDASNSVDQAMAVTVTHGCAASNPTASASSAHNVARDCETLLDLEDALRGTATTLNWAVATAMTSWTGVTVDSTKGVTRLDLISKSLTGKIPPALGSLSELTLMNLNGNQLSGAIPKELGNLSRLTELHLESTALSGSIPSELGNLSNLTVLNLGYNELSGKIPAELGSLSSLLHLKLDHNNLEGAVPAELGQLTSITTDGLGLTFNKLTSIPGELSNLTDLDTLSLAGNRFTSIPAGIGSMTWVTHVLLQDNLLTEFPAALTTMTGVTQISLERNRMRGSIPSWIGNLSSLEILHVDDNQLSGSIPSELGGITSLGTLSLSGNRLSGPIPSELGNLTSLTDLGLEKNQLSGPIPPELGSMSSLQYLHLQDNRLSGSIPPELGGLSSLNHFYLHQNQLSGSIPSQLGNLSTLTHLNLNQNRLDGSIPTQLGSLSNLQVLALRSNQLSGGIPMQLGSLANLQQLLLNDNQLTGGIPTQLGSLSNLQYLYLYRNQLSGSIPSSLGSLSSLFHLILFDNKLTGSIPTQLGNLSSLQLLYLHRNQLSGSIPSSLGSLSNLSTAAPLYLNCNQLSGAVPTQLNNLASGVQIWLQGNPITVPTTPAGLVNRLRLTGAAGADGTPEASWCGPPAFAAATDARSIVEQLAATDVGAPLAAVDPDNQPVAGTQPTTYTLSGPDAAFFAVDGSGQVAVKEPLDFESPLDADGDNQYQITLTADDGVDPEARGGTDSIDVTITVTDGADDVLRVGTLGAVSLHTGASRTLDATDAFSEINDLPLTYAAFSSNPAAVSVSVDGARVTIRSRSAGTATVVVSASNGTLWAAHRIAVTVNDRPSSRHPRLSVEVAGPAGPVRVGERIEWRFTLRNTGTVPLSGVFWRSPQLDVARQTVGDGTLAVGAEAVVTARLTVTAAHLPGPLTVTFHGDSDQTDDPSAAWSAAVAAAAPTPRFSPEPAEGPGRRVVVETVRYTAPAPHLAHTIPTLRVSFTGDAAGAAPADAVVCDFLGHYDATGGLERWGWPISEVMVEQPRVFTQYYQRGIVDCQQREGVWRMERRLVWDYLGGGLAGSPDLGVEPELISERPGQVLGPWGHRVSDYAVDGTYTSFLNVFERLGGVAAFGYPKTDARTDTHPEAVLALPGATPGFVRQYFQAAVFEYHPGAPDQPVKLALLGDAVRDLLYPAETWREFEVFAPAPPHPNPLPPQG